MDKSIRLSQPPFWFVRTEGIPGFLGSPIQDDGREFSACSLIRILCRLAQERTLTNSGKSSDRAKGSPLFRSITDCTTWVVCMNTTSLDRSESFSGPVCRRRRKEIKFEHRKMTNGRGGMLDCARVSFSTKGYILEEIPSPPF